MIRFLFFFQSFALILSAETVFFSNGDVLTGDIWRKTNSNLILVSEHGNYKILSSHVDKVLYGGKKRFRMILKTGVINTIYPVESNKKEIIYREEKNKDSETTKSISWEEVFAIRIAK